MAKEKTVNLRDRHKTFELLKGLYGQRPEEKADPPGASRTGGDSTLVETPVPEQEAQPDADR